MNRKSKMEQDQIVALYISGDSVANISIKTGIHRDTISNHLKTQGYKIRRGRPAKTGNFGLRVPTGSGSNPAISKGGCPPGPKDSISLCTPYREFIQDRLGRGMDAYYIWYDLKEELGFTGAYDSVKRYVRKLRKKVPEVFAVIPTLPGQEAQVDYGRGAPTRHPETGKFKRPWLFCLKLSHSRKTFRKVVWKSSSEVWAKLHEEAFCFFGGVPALVVLDNLKEGVVKPDIYDPELNPLYAKLLEHYGSVALPCRVGTPRHKGKVESEVKYTQGALKGRSFEQIEDQQRFLNHWGNNCADTRIHGTTKRQVQEVFLSEDKPALKPLPDESFTLTKILSRKVHTDAHVVVENAYYSVPHTHVGQDVLVYVDKLWVMIQDNKTGLRLAKHSRSKAGRYNTDQDHLPELKQMAWLHRNLLSRAKAIGQAAQVMVEGILQRDPHRSIRSVQGILSFTRKYAPSDIENAARLCVSNGLMSYRALKNILEHRQSTTQKNLPLNLIQQHHCIRSVSDYSSLWERCAPSSGENHDP